jgi:hypothetical protein
MTAAAYGSRISARCARLSGTTKPIFRFKFQTADVRPHSRGTMLPEVCMSLSLKNEGAGNAGCALHPRSRVQNGKTKRTRAYRAAEAIRHSLRNGFTAYIALSPAIGLVCHRRQRIWLASPGWAWKTSADLTPASRRQNHTTLPYAAAPFVSARLIAHGSWLNPKPALQFTCAPNAAASTASHPNVRDDGQRPFLRDRMAGVLEMICPTAKAKICPSGYFVAATAAVRAGTHEFGLVGGRPALLRTPDSPQTSRDVRNVPISAASPPSSRAGCRI